MHTLKKANIFRRSLEELRRPRTIVVTAMLIALNIAFDLLGLKIYLTPELRISVGFVCNASVGMLYGPVVGMMTGFCTDVLGFLLSPNNNAGYFPGYTLTAIVGGLIYGLTLYKGKPTLGRCIAAKLSVNLLCNIGLNGLWSVIVYQKGFWALLPGRLYKNLVLLPLEVGLLYLVANVVLRQFRRVFSDSVSS